MTVRNVRQTIGKCLDSLENQSYRGDFEIVVVDAVSTDGTLEYLRERAEANPNLRLIMKPSTQPEALRYAVLEGHIESECVAMIDGDVVADRDWLLELMKGMDEGHLVVGGPCYTPKYVNILQRLIGYDLDMRFLRMKEGPLTRLPNMNLCVNREFFAKIGFDASYELGYDMEFGHRIRRMGYQIWFNPRAVVWHYHRSSVHGFVNQQVHGSEYALRVFGKFPNAWHGDNINPFRMLVDAPLLMLMVLFVILSPFGWLFMLLACMCSVCILSSIAFKTVELTVKFRKPETVLCGFLYLARAECWLIGLANYLRKSLRRTPE